MLTRRFNFICLTVVIAALAGILTPTAKADNRSKPTHRILKSASELDYPPFALVRPDGSADGFSVDLLKAVTQAVGLEINFIVGPWHKIKQKLVDGHLDVLPLVSYSQEREKVYDFTAPYLRMHGTIFVRKGEKIIRGQADLKDKEVIVMRGDTAHEYVVRENLSDKLILTATFEEAMRLLSKGKHDAVVIQQLVGLQLIKKLGISNVVNVSTFQETSLKPVDKPLSGFEQKFCIAVQDGDKELLALLNEGLAIAIANGTYDELYNKWFSPILPQPPVPLTLILRYLLFILVPLLFLLGIMVLWYLKREVAQKTQSLNKEIKYRKKAGEALQESDLKYRQLVEQLQEGIWAIDKDANTTFVNPRMAEMIGYTVDEMQGKHLFSFMDKRGIDISKRNLERRKQGIIEQHDFELLHKNGERVYTSMETSPVTDENGNYVGALACVADITQRKRIEDALQNAHDNLEQQVQNRTAQLVSANELLGIEIEERKYNEKKLLEHQVKLRSLSSELLLTEERERRHIATELHDRIGQTLAVTKIKLGELRGVSTSNETFKIMDDIQEFIEQTIKDTRSLTFELSPPVLYELGLEAALAWLVNQTRQKHGLQIEFNDDGQTKPLDNSCRVIIFQAARELIFNIVKHARAQRATVSVRKDNDAIRIDIEDDGLGFDISELSATASSSRGFGLFSIRERINPLGGRMEIQSAPGGGTRTTIVLPLACNIDDTGSSVSWE